MFRGERTRRESAPLTGTMRLRFTTKTRRHEAHVDWKRRSPLRSSGPFSATLRVSFASSCLRGVIYIVPAWTTYIAVAKSHFRFERFFRPFKGACGFLRDLNPALKRWAIFGRPCGTSGANPFGNDFWQSLYIQSDARKDAPSAICFGMAQRSAPSTETGRAFGPNRPAAGSRFDLLT
jgi:hypothetical protein